MFPHIPDRNPGTPRRSQPPGGARAGGPSGENRSQRSYGPPRQPYQPGREISRRDFHAPTTDRHGNPPGDRPGTLPAAARAPDENLWRMFIAVDLPAEAKAALTGTARSVPDFLRPAVRWSRAEMMHLTVRFLGDMECERVDAIGECMRDAAERSGRFTLNLDDTGAFPTLNQPRVFWVGIAGEVDRLQMLHTRLEGTLARIGIDPEDRRYNPHLTVGRLQREVPPFTAGQVGQAFAHARLPEPRPVIPVESLILYRSRLLLDGPRYEELARAPLG